MRESQRILPTEMTEAIYAALTVAEESIMRMTEPLPPFEARLLRSHQAIQLEAHEDAAITLSIPRIHRADSIFSRRFCDVVPDWDSIVEHALSSLPRSIKNNIGKWSSLGKPQGELSIRYGYDIVTEVRSGRQADLRLDTHGALLMGCQENSWPPGEMRDLVDKLL